MNKIALENLNEELKNAAWLSSDDQFERDLVLADSPCLGCRFNDGEEHEEFCGNCPL